MGANKEIANLIEHLTKAYALSSSFVLIRIIIEMLLPFLGFIGAGMTTEAASGAIVSLTFLMVRVALPLLDPIDIFLRLAAFAIYFILLTKNSSQPKYHMM